MLGTTPQNLFALGLTVGLIVINHAYEKGKARVKLMLRLRSVLIYFRPDTFNYLLGLFFSRRARMDKANRKCIPSQTAAIFSQRQRGRSVRFQQRTIHVQIHRTNCRKRTQWPPPGWWVSPMDKTQTWYIYLAQDNITWDNGSQRRCIV